jgi:hypothetical protein
MKGCSMAVKGQMFIDQSFLLFYTTKAFSTAYEGYACKRIRKEKGYSHAPLTPHMRFFLAWLIRENFKTCLDIGSGISFIERLIMWIVDAINVHDLDVWVDL